jgi:hypothetical protein
MCVKGGGAKIIKAVSVSTNLPNRLHRSSPDPKDVFALMPLSSISTMRGPIVIGILLALSGHPPGQQHESIQDKVEP